MYTLIGIYYLYLQVVPGGIAARSGSLRVGDRILAVNGHEVATATHQEAVGHLLAPTPEVVLKVRHDPLPTGYQVSLVIGMFSFPQVVYHCHRQIHH